MTTNTTNATNAANELPAVPANPAALPGMSRLGISQLPLLLLAACCLLPAVQTLLAVYLQWHTAISYSVLKAVMIAIPIVIWWRRRDMSLRDWLGWKRPSLRGSVGVGVLMAGVILGGYYVGFRNLLDPAPVAAKVRALGLIEYYWAMTVVVSLWNSLLEEYYWRVFLFGEFRRYLPGKLAVCLLGGFLFGLHHIFALLPLFDWPMVALFTVGTMAAGAVWSWMRVRGRSIVDCYISHLMADVAIMWIGYDLIMRAV